MVGRLPNALLVHRKPEEIVFLVPSSFQINFICTEGTGWLSLPESISFFLEEKPGKDFLFVVKKTTEEVSREHFAEGKKKPKVTREFEDLFFGPKDNTPRTLNVVGERVSKKTLEEAHSTVKESETLKKMMKVGSLRKKRANLFPSSDEVEKQESLSYSSLYEFTEKGRKVLLKDLGRFFSKLLELMPKSQNFSLNGYFISTYPLNIPGSFEPDGTLVSKTVEREILSASGLSVEEEERTSQVFATFGLTAVVPNLRGEYLKQLFLHLAENPEDIDQAYLVINDFSDENSWSLILNTNKENTLPVIKPVAVILEAGVQEIYHLGEGFSSQNPRIYHKRSSSRTFVSLSDGYDEYLKIGQIQGSGKSSKLVLSKSDLDRVHDTSLEVVSIVLKDSSPQQEPPLRQKAQLELHFRLALLSLLLMVVGKRAVRGEIYLPKEPELCLEGKGFLLYDLGVLSDPRDEALVSASAVFGKSFSFPRIRRYVESLNDWLIDNLEKDLEDKDLDQIARLSLSMLRSFGHALSGISFEDSSLVFEVPMWQDLGMLEARLAVRAGGSLLLEVLKEDVNLTKPLREASLTIGFTR